MWLEKAIHLRHGEAKPLNHETASNSKLEKASHLETIFMIPWINHLLWKVEWIQKDHKNISTGQSWNLVW